MNQLLLVKKWPNPQVCNILLFFLKSQKGDLIAEYGDDPEFMALQKKIKEREERERKEK